MKNKSELFRKSALLVTAFALSLGASACNTVKGLGDDIKSVGEAGEDAID